VPEGKKQESTALKKKFQIDLRESTEPFEKPFATVQSKIPSYQTASKHRSLENKRAHNWNASNETSAAQETSSPEMYTTGTCPLHRTYTACLLKNTPSQQ